MNATFERELEIFAEALKLPDPGRRADYLDQSCGDDVELRRRIEALLKAHAEAGTFLQPAVGEGGVAMSYLSGCRGASVATERVGDIIGHYKLLQRIGEGGCGVVYMADQVEPVRRRVALKIIKLGMDTQRVIARFKAEEQALAMMDHPNIAKVFDAGATENGRPYFVMELVRGVKITEYCAQNHLATKDRLGLFVKVCQAIHHAHQKGVVHRDIKPSNILVSEDDGVAIPKVIDFGIAKATEGRLTDETLLTAFEQFLGTPAYMSPEQAVMTNLELDRRSDVYSLGVLLYELLAGAPPFDPKALMAAGLDEMRRTIREVEPPLPSTRLTREAAERGGKHAEVASNRTGSSVNILRARAPQTSPRKELIAALRGDLDWIVMKCLEKDRQRRYQTAVGLAEDVQRHLGSRPVQARPPSTIYRVQKLVRRRKVELAMGSALAIVASLALLLTGWRAAQARHAEVAALRQAELARAAHAEAMRALASEATMARHLDEIMRVGFSGSSTSAVLAVTALRSPGFMDRLLANDESVTWVPEEVCQAYLARNRTNAESLVAAEHVRNDADEDGRQVLRRAATSFPDNPQMLYTAVTMDLFPEDRQTWIERFKAADPENALPLYLSARARLKQGDWSGAYEELQSAVQLATLNDYAVERIQAVEEIYLQEGRSPAEAKATATFGCVLPHLSLLKDLAKDMAALQNQYLASGDPVSAEHLAQMGTLVGRELSVGSGAKFVIDQVVGLGIEGTVLAALDPQRTYGWLGTTPAARNAELDVRTTSLKQELKDPADGALARLTSEADILAYFDRVKLYGEVEASRWLAQRFADAHEQP